MGLTVSVEPAEVSAAGATVKGAAGGVSGAAGHLTTTGIKANGFTTSETLADFCQAWGSTLRTFATTCTSSGEALVSNATTYNVQESTISGKLRAI